MSTKKNITIKNPLQNINFKEVKSWVYLAGFIIGIYVIGRIFGVFKSSAARAEGRRDRETLSDAEREVNKQPLSFPLFRFNAMADAIYNALRFSALDDKPQIAEDILLQMQNDSDIAQLYLSYGRRQRHRFGIPDGGPEDLYTTIRREFRGSRIRRVNENYQAKGMSFQF